MNPKDQHARWSYDQLLLQQPHVEFDGLWVLNDDHFVLCVGLCDARTTKNESLRRWFDHSCRVIGARISLVETLPQGAVRLPERTTKERIELVGAPRTLRDLLYDLSLILPADFPPFDISETGSTVNIVTSRVLTDLERDRALAACSTLDPDLSLGFSVVDAIQRTPPGRPDGSGPGLALVPSRRLPTTVGRDLRWLVEEDEEFWLEKRHAVLGSALGDPSAVLPAGWHSKNGLACLVDATVFPPENLRTYLCLYETIFLALPIQERFHSACKAMAITVEELKELVALGRVKLLLPQSVTRYPTQWLSAVAEASSKNCIPSRRLAAATVVDARRRVPLLYPPFAPHERYALLHALHRCWGKLASVKLQSNVEQFLAELGVTWSMAEWSIHERGAMGTSHLGAGFLAAEIYQRISGQDQRLELWTAAQKVEWAAALGAHVFPSQSEGYNEVPACDLVAGIYCPKLSASLLPPAESLLAVADLVALDGDMPILPFAREFSSTNIDRLRRLVLDLTTQNVDAASLRAAIDQFNADVRHYESRSDRLKSLNVVGLLAASATAAGIVDPELQRIVPLAGALLGFLINQSFSELQRSTVSLGKVIDWADSFLAGRPNAAAVMVSRVRKELKGINT